MKTNLVILASVLLVLGVLGIVSVYADTQSTSVTASVTVPGTISISANNLIFASTIPGNSNSNNLNVIIDSNAAYTVNTKANAVNFTGGPTPFAVSNLVFGVSSTPYTTSDQILATGSAPGTTHVVNHTLTVPLGTQAGSYNVGITLTATQP